MQKSLKLALPALFPSWRFFHTIAPAPRVEFALLKTQQDTPNSWHELHARPDHLTFWKMLARMFWNPRWNEVLFIISCAERLIQEPTKHSEDEIFKRIKITLTRDGTDTSATPYLQFRLIFLSRDGTFVQKHTLYTSPVRPCSESTDS